MCRPPMLVIFGDAPVEFGTFGLGMGTQGSYWNVENLPISMHTFHHLARGALLRWWDVLAQRSQCEQVAGRAPGPG